MKENLTTFRTCLVASSTSLLNLCCPPFLFLLNLCLVLYPSCGTVFGFIVYQSSSQFTANLVTMVCSPPCDGIQIEQAVWTMEWTRPHQCNKCMVTDECRDHRYHPKYILCNMYGWRWRHHKMSLHTLTLLSMANPKSPGPTCSTSNRRPGPTLPVQEPRIMIILTTS